MSSVSKRLKSLGVHIGTEGIVSRVRHSHETRNLDYANLEKQLHGKLIDTPHGQAFVIETIYPANYRHGKEVLGSSPQLDGLSNWTNLDGLNKLPRDAFAFIDTETTGLSGGAGTYAFLIGVGRYIDDDFHLYQLSMQDPIEELPQLRYLEQILAPCKALVTFNGKSFDIPLLKSRYLFNQWPIPFEDYFHIDILQLARKLWRDRLPSRTLGNLECQILDLTRTDEDIPGWEIPQIYFDYLNTGDVSFIKRVIYHNAMDIVSLAALFNHTARLLFNPLESGTSNKIDIISLGKLYEGMGDVDMASRLYHLSLESDNNNYQDLPINFYIDALTRLALLYKRKQNYSISIGLWKKAALYHNIPAFIELAKYYEHKEKDFEQALIWTQLAIRDLKNTAQQNSMGKITLNRWLPDLMHRESRLLRKLSVR